MKKTITVVFEADDSLHLTDFWAAVHKSIENVTPIMGRVGNIMHRDQIFQQYALGLQAAVASGALPDTNQDPPLLISLAGTHFWKFFGGIYADNLNLFSGTRMYFNRADLELHEGVCHVPDPITHG